MQRRAPFAIFLAVAISQYAACRNFNDDRPHAISEEQAGTMGFSGADGGGGTHTTASSTAGEAGQTVSAAGGQGGGSPVEGEAGSGSANANGGVPSSTDSVGPDEGFGGAEEVLVPSCAFGAGANPIDFTTPSALSVNLLQGGGPYEIFATQPTSNLMAYRWYDTYSTTWFSWNCFDLVPHPARVAATNLLGNLFPEVYVTTKLGSMFVRRFYSTSSGWGEWEPLQLPTSRSMLSDVAVVGSPSRILFLYVIDGGAILVRHRVSAEPFSAYGPWHRLGAPFQAKRICGAVGIDQIQNIAALSSDGSVFVSKQNAASPDAAFSDFEPLGLPSQTTFDELQCGYLADGTIVLFGLGGGAIWSRTLGTSSEWTEESGNSPYIQTFSVGSRPGSNSTVFAADASNAIWSHLDGSEEWDAIIDPQ